MSAPFTSVPSTVLSSAYARTQESVYPAPVVSYQFQPRGTSNRFRPEGLANRVSGLIGRLLDASYQTFDEFFDLTWISLGYDPDPLRYSEDYKKNSLQARVARAEIETFLDICEMMLQAADRIRWSVGKLLIEIGLSEAFLHFRFGFRIVGTEVVEAGTDAEN